MAPRHGKGGSQPPIIGHLPALGPVKETGPRWPLLGHNNLQKGGIPPDRRDLTWRGLYREERQPHTVADGTDTSSVQPQPGIDERKCHDSPTLQAAKMRSSPLPSDVTRQPSRAGPMKRV